MPVGLSGCQKLLKKTRCSPPILIECLPFTHCKPEEELKSVWAKWVSTQHWVNSERNGSSTPIVGMRVSPLAARTGDKPTESSVGYMLLMPGACTRSTLKRLVNSFVGVIAQLYSTPPFWAFFR